MCRQQVWNVEMLCANRTRAPEDLKLVNPISRPYVRAHELFHQWPEQTVFVMFCDAMCFQGSVYGEGSLKIECATDKAQISGCGCLEIYIIYIYISERGMSTCVFWVEGSPQIVNWSYRCKQVYNITVVCVCVHCAHTGIALGKFRCCTMQ